jgi:formate dehydrogenase major subunit
VDGSRYGTPRAGSPVDASHPYLRVMLDRCIRCRRCVDACAVVQGRFVFDVVGRGADTRIAWDGGAFAASPCVACGACVAACPTGALTDADREPGEAADRVVRTTCGYCGVGCQLDVAVGSGRVRRIDGAEAAVNRGHLCVKGRYAHGWTRHADRLTHPLVRRDGRLVEASWDEAIALVAARLGTLRGAVAGLSSSRCTNEENYLFQKWLRAAFGTNHVDCCARVCHAPSAAGMRASFGVGAATNGFADIDEADLLLVVGANPTDAHPVVGARIRAAALRGARLVVIDPRRTELAEIADVHLRPKPGANVPVLNALACALVEAGRIDRAFIAARVDDFTAWRPFILGQRPETMGPLAGVPAAGIRRAAALLADARRPMMMHGLGVTEHQQGSESVMLLCNLALLLGAVGRPGTGVNPLRGQNNVQGAADMGCVPDMLPGYQPVTDAEARARCAAVWGRPVPERPGWTLPEMWDHALAGRLRGMFILGEDVVQTDPHAGHTREALSRLEFLAVQELFLSETAQLAHVVLPAAGPLEKDGTFTNGERRIQRVRRAVHPPGEARPDWRILCNLMTAGGLRQQFRDPGAVMDEIARVAPIYGGVSYARLEGDGLRWPVPDAAHPGTPILHVDGFPIGRARLHRVEYRPSPESRSPLTLTTGRVLEHYNAGTMTRRTPNRDLAPEDRLEIHPDDAAARGVVDGDPVVIANARGEARARAFVTDRVPPGTAFLSFHFPESGVNALTSDLRDTVTGCPEYKVTAAEVRPARATDRVQGGVAATRVASAAP